MTFFSSWGPTDDGRLKPDIVAPGCQVGGDNGIKSTAFRNSNGARNGYRVECGTSLATPVAAGTGVLLLEQWKRLQANRIQPSTVKAILVHTATDLGNPGPDYQFGWGKLNANMAVNHIRLDDNLRSITPYNLIIHDTVDASRNKDYVIRSAGESNVKITLAWDDPPATRLATTTLINDLDLRLVDPDGITYSPFILNPTSPNNAATTGDDNRNNVEMVIGNAKPGIWRLTVDGRGVSQGPQIFSLISSDGMINLDSVRPQIRLTQAESGIVPGTENRVNLLGIPLPVTTSNSISFSFSGRSDFGIARFECRLNADPVRQCGNPSGQITESGTIAFSSLDSSLNGGENTFTVTAIDTLNKRASIGFVWYVCAGTQEKVDMCLQLHAATRDALFTLLCPGNCSMPPVEEIIKKIKDFHPEYNNVTNNDIIPLLKTGIFTNQTVANPDSNNLTESEIKQ
jgi:hypothetical protein